MQTSDLHTRKKNQKIRNIIAQLLQCARSPFREAISECEAMVNYDCAYNAPTYLLFCMCIIKGRVLLKRALSYVRHNGRAKKLIIGKTFTLITFMSRVPSLTSQTRPVVWSPLDSTRTFRWWNSAKNPSCDLYWWNCHSICNKQAMMSTRGGSHAKPRG